MQTRFLIGPAGSGKTTRCLDEIRAELRVRPQGPPLIFLAPKQATFGIERQLLADDSLRGYTRLQILSFDRLADYVLGEFAAHPAAAREALSDEGRVMVLRALLARHQRRLRLFRSTARLPGFAQHLSLLLRELQEHRISPARLSELAACHSAGVLADKLHDIALLLDAYRRWLEAEKLEDAHTRLDAAATLLRARTAPESASAAKAAASRPLLWLDGFAEMTPQELHLLAAFVPVCHSATLAFCLETAPSENGNGASWLSLWTVVAQTFRRCRHALEAIEGNVVTVEPTRSAECGTRNRFAASPLLGHVESAWSSGTPISSSDIHQSSLRIVTCSNPEAEATFAAREILSFVREHGARFRDCAVLLRTLDGHHDSLRRVFTRYGIPFFLDRREPVTHHPLAELTRFALRTVAFGWKRDDWFGALKTGLVHHEDEALDALENEARRRGWDGTQWTETLRDEHAQPHYFEPLRQRLAPPFTRLGAAVQGDITGPQLSAALRTLWSDLEIETTLERWSAEAQESAPLAVRIHDTVWTQMNAWLDNVELAFNSESLPVAEWLPVLEAGLANLSVGVIPPALDQVLVGAIDRSRNPELRLVILPGMNETIFPAPPPRPPILSEIEREKLAEALNAAAGSRPASTAPTPCPLALTTRQRLAHERFFAYIACTRSRERLVLTCSAADSRGRPLNPSPFLAHLERLVPGVFPAEPARRETFHAPGWREAVHPHELAAPVLNRVHPALEPFRAEAPFLELAARHEEGRRAAGTKQLAAEIVAHLYANPLPTSVSALEKFASCPFKFFLNSGLRVQEREEFEIDHRRRGSFQHDILEEFHRRATAGGRRWRDWTPDQARELVGGIGNEKLNTFQQGLFTSEEARRFTGRTLIGNLENLIGTLIGWMAHYQFDPQAVEVEFGISPESPLPAWRIDLGNDRALLLRGRIDRLDLYQTLQGETLAAVLDYKSSPRKVNATKLHNGLELQLLSYVGLLRQATPAAALPKLKPVGVFYVGLRGQSKAAASRDEALNDAATKRRKSFQHSGRFDKSAGELLDSHGGSEQFATHHASKNAMDPVDFEALIAGVEEHLRRFGNQILDGAVEIAPFRKGSETSCDHCEFATICRFDPWTESYRKLEPVPPKPKAEKPDKPVKRAKAKKPA